ncbi:aminotransferase class V-fold PLP-dependent enzyme, partial [Nocardia brasiliensis]|uniref:aminotransferase class V-fold PLP-dependent enzyme n=1 Tax=Nocardia brasiliensis TaxID=37326 RepID=UPI00245699FD
MRPPAERSSAAPAQAAVRKLFPALAESTEVYLDSAATTQKPRPVIDVINHYHSSRTANAGRGTYPWATSLSGRITRIRQRPGGVKGAAPARDGVLTGGATAARKPVALWRGQGGVAG